MPTKIGGKIKGKMQSKWTLTTNKQGTRCYVSTSIDKRIMKLLEYWAPVLVADKKIENNSAYAAARYALENGILGLDKVMREQFSKEKEDEPNAGPQDTCSA